MFVAHSSKRTSSRAWSKYAMGKQATLPGSGITRSWTHLTQLRWLTTPTKEALANFTLQRMRTLLILRTLCWSRFSRQLISCKFVKIRRKSQLTHLWTWRPPLKTVWHSKEHTHSSWIVSHAGITDTLWALKTRQVGCTYQAKWTLDR